MFRSSSSSSSSANSTIVGRLLFLLLLIVVVLPVKPVHGLQIGDAVCVEGYIMDFFCIQRGTLLDAPSIITLEEPEEHSVHCLIDVSSCVNSPYEILLPPNEESNGLYRRGWRVDEEGRNQLIALGKQVGICSDCDGTGTLRKGFYAAIRGTVQSLPTDSTPPILKVDAVLDGTAQEVCALAPTTSTNNGSSGSGNNSNELVIGKPVCVEGFIMDFFCIQRGTLLDAPSIVTLEQPDQHSVHCLIDVSSCVNSPYEILLPPNMESNGLYRRGWRVDDAGRDQLITLGKEVGICSDCDGTGTLRNGFSAAVKGTIQTLATSDIPPILLVEDVFFGTATEFCNTGSNNGDNVFQIVMDVDFMVSSSDDTFQRTAYLHGSLMLISWGWMLPMGAIFAKTFKHRPNGLWFTIHRSLQTVGLVFAIIGWIIALKNFTSLQDKGLNNYKHAILGCTTMVLGILQPINAILRPHAPKVGEEKESIRFLWELVHKGLGYSSLLLAIATIGYGTTLLPDPDVQMKFQMAYAIGVGTTILVVVTATMLDKSSYQEVPTTTVESSTKHDDDDDNKKVSMARGTTKGEDTSLQEEAQA